MRKKSEFQVMSCRVPVCNYGYCTLLSEASFTRVLRLERQRTERSRMPFILVLMNLEDLGTLNGDQTRLVNAIVAGLTSFTRETDTTGWYREGSVLGTIFTELGNPKDLSGSVVSIMSKVASLLERQLGQERRSKIKISCHIFPEDQPEKRFSGTIDTELYPDLHAVRNSGWLDSTSKRIIDIVLSGSALIALSPLFLLIAVAVKLSSRGPVLFRQNRVGQFGKHFSLLKFRSMQLGNESTIHEQYVRKLIRGDMASLEKGVFKIQNDPRVTSIGHFLRKSSLDELPQFWNVLIGDMSLVGPRPPLSYEVEIYDLWHRRRLVEAKPGITGLWQVTGRSRTCFDDMVRLDLQYSRHSSLWLDLKILLKTPVAVLAGDGAL